MNASTSEITVNTTSPAFLKARSSLPEHLHPTLEQMCREYKCAALETIGQPLFSPRVIAKLILMGWRSP
jgi:hypothetical protein